MLTSEQLRLRDGKITGSFAPALMAGDTDAIMNKWRELVGDDAYMPEDLSRKWPVQFGSYVEPFAIDWHQRITGRALTRRGEVVIHPARPYASVTLDAYRADDACVLDVKAPGAWRKIDEICSWYAPQMVMQRDCVGAQRAALLIVHGGAEPAEYPIEIAPEYAAAVWERVDWFWDCVNSLTPPFPVDPVAAPVAAVKEYEMAGNNAWCAHAADWLATKDAANKFKGAEKELKSLVPADAVRCHGAAIEIKRDRAGRLGIKQLKGA